MGCGCAAAGKLISNRSGCAFRPEAFCGDAGSGAAAKRTDVAITRPINVIDNSPVPLTHWRTRMMPPVIAVKARL
jgi:hypothetical protein